MGSDFLHSFGDAAKASQDNRVIQGKANGVYQQYRAQICGGVYFCILEIYDGMVTELKKLHFFEKIVPLDEKKAEMLFEATMQNASSDKEKLDNIIVCIGMFPGNRKITDELMLLLSGYRNDEFGEWLEFWHLDYRYPNYKENKKSAEEFDDFMIEKGVRQFTFRDPNVAPYVQLRKWIYEYYEKYSVDSIPGTSQLTDIIKDYYKYFVRTGKTL